MLALILSLLGFGALAAGGGGGSSGGSTSILEADGTVNNKGSMSPHDNEPKDHDGNDNHDNGDKDNNDHDGKDKTDPDSQHGNDHDAHDTSGSGGHDDGGDNEHDNHEPIPLPQSPEETAAFVEAVRNSPEMHAHHGEASKMEEHMAALELVPRDEATHIAINSGDWDDPANWHNGEVPGDDAKALIPEDVHMTYDHVSEARLFTVRVDGHLEFAPDVDSQLVVDTIVISPSGALTIGTEEEPVAPDVDVDIIFANNGQIDTNWDPLLLSRGMITHGSVQIHGAVKDSHEKVIDDPQKGDTSIKFAEAPEGWVVGDTIVIAGTHYDGYLTQESGVDYAPSEDEVRVITKIEDEEVFFDDPLEFDHDTARADLKTSVANYTRSVSFETENAEFAEIFERGHVMFMHNDDVDVRYAEFHELGRTDKSETAVNAGDINDIDFDTNLKGRYSFHFHRAGLDDIEDPAIATGNAVFGSPGWGFVHHDSNAILDNNATFNTFGAGYVAESGNETGAWTDNIAIFAKGSSWGTPKSGNDLANFDLGQTGDGFWFQGRMVESVDNIAASVNHGFVYFHRGEFGDAANIPFDASTSDVGDILYNGTGIPADKHPILSFSGNEVFAAAKGMWVLKASPNQSHDVHSVLEDFTAWNVNVGAGLEYTSHYVLKDFDIIGNEPSETTPEGYVGILFGGNVSDITIIDATVENFATGAYLSKNFTNPIYADELHEYTIIDPTFINVGVEYGDFDPTIDRVVTSDELPYLTPDIALDGPLTYDVDARWVNLTGTKTDSLGQSDFPAGTDTYIVRQTQVNEVLKENGYFTTSDGQNYFMMEIYFSDGLTGDIYVEEHPVLLGANTPRELNLLPDAEFKGVQDLGGAQDPTIDTAQLWATLTDGQIIFSEDFPDPDEDEVLMDEAA